MDKSLLSERYPGVCRPRAREEGGRREEEEGALDWSLSRPPVFGRKMVAARSNLTSRNLTSDIFPATFFLCQFCGVEKICHLQSCRFCTVNCLQNPDFVVEIGPIRQGKFSSKKKILNFARYRLGHYSALFTTSLQHFDFFFFFPSAKFW